MRVVKKTRLAGRLAVDQPGGAMRVQLNHPVSHDLQRHAADPGRLGARGAVADRGQRQQPAGLVSILAVACRRVKAGGVKLLSKRDRHREAARFAILESNSPRVGQPPRVTIDQGWYNCNLSMCNKTTL